MRGSGMGPAPWGWGAEAEERFQNSGKTPLWRGNQLGQKGNIWGCRKRVKQPICGRWGRVRNTQTIRTATLRSPDWDVCSQVCKAAGSWSTGIGEQTQSENCCWLWGDVLREWERGNPQQGMPMEEDQTAMEAGATAESQVGGEATIVASLSPHTDTCWWTIKKPPLGWTLCSSSQEPEKAQSGLALTCLALGTRNVPH